jgi:putative membrane protein
MKYLLWLLKAAIFFTLFAFALNNQHDATVYFFFGTNWRAPLVLVVLAAFAGGVVVGALGMLPGWWKHRSAAAARMPSARGRAESGTVAPGGSTTKSTSSPGGVPAVLTDLPAVRQHGL